MYGMLEGKEGIKMTETKRWIYEALEREAVQYNDRVDELEDFYKAVNVALDGLNCPLKAMSCLKSECLSWRPEIFGGVAHSIKCNSGVFGRITVDRNGKAFVLGLGE